MSIAYKKIFKGSYYGYLVLLLMSLTGCATMQQPSEEAYSSRTSNLKVGGKIKSWNSRGSIAVKTERNGWNASFNWQQDADRYSLNFFGPLGSNRLSLNGNQDYAELETGNQVQEDSNAEALLQRRLGWYLPVNSIYYWIRGLPAPGKFSKLLRNSNHEIMVLEQDHWRVTYKAYQYFNDNNLPTLIELENSKLSIRIAIYQWDL